MKDDAAFLLDILLAARDARSFTAPLDWPAFRASRLHQNAVIRSLEVIGEAASKVSPGFRDAHPQKSRWGPGRIILPGLFMPP